MIKLILGFFAVILSGGIFFYYTQPAYDSVKGTQESIAQYNAALDKAAELQKLKQTLLSRYNSFDPEARARLQKLLPDHVDNIALILDLDSIASRYGLAVQNVDISGGSGKTSAKQTATAAVGSSNQAYDSLTMTFSTQGTYANFQKFLTDLESSLRIVELSGLSISRSASSQGSGEPVYSYTVTLRTFWLK